MDLKGEAAGVGEDTEDKDKWALMVGLWAREGGAGCYGNGCRLLERVHQGVSSRCLSAAHNSAALLRRFL